MAISTYSELTAAIADWLNRSDLTSAIPSFISLSEAQMNRNLRVRQMVSRSEATIDTKYSALPAGFLETKNFKVISSNPITPIEFATEEQLDDYDASTTAAGKPKYFGVVGNQVRVHPSPDTGYTCELVYYAQIPALSGTNTTNWLLTSSPDAYLYGALSQSAPYLKDDERIAVWASLYTSALESIKNADIKSNGAGLMKSRVKPFGVR